MSDDLSKEQRSALSIALALIGRKGGRAKVPKGFASLTPAQRKANAKAAAAKRWAKETV